MASASQKFQSPKGTRDFYPQDMAVRRYIENVWRTVSINHGFDEIEGPTFEHLELYTHKSGPGIASELFQVFSGKDEEQIAAIRSGQSSPYAMRPEFTPTLARMVAARAGELPRPIKWFAIPSHFRAERPQRGRLREFMQWNVDFIGEDSPRADAEVIATAVGSLRELGLQSKDVSVRISHREFIADALKKSGVASENLDAALAFLDKRGKISEQEFRAGADELSLNVGNFESASSLAGTFVNNSILAREQGGPEPSREEIGPLAEVLRSLVNSLAEAQLLRWCEFDPSIVRGLAYYTGTVFEIHEATGAERAIAGGGRYDKLIESFGGPSLPACGFGMGDVVLANILKDKGLLKPAEEYMPRPHAFVIAADDDAAAKLPSLVANLRKQGFHIRHSYKTTRNVGKLLGDAAKSRAHSAIILGKELQAGNVMIKNLESGEQKEIPLDSIPNEIRSLLRNDH